MLEILFILIGFALLLVLVTAVSVFMYVAMGTCAEKGMHPRWMGKLARHVGVRHSGSAAVCRGLLASGSQSSAGAGA
jgi:hypothetical protein